MGGPPSEGALGGAPSCLLHMEEVVSVALDYSQFIPEHKTTRAQGMRQKKADSTVQGGVPNLQSISSKCMVFPLCFV